MPTDTEEKESIIRKQSYGLCSSCFKELRDLGKDEVLNEHEYKMNHLEEFQFVEPALLRHVRRSDSTEGNIHQHIAWPRFKHFIDGYRS